MESYPLQSSLSTAAQLTCQFDGCAKVYSSFKGLVKHLKDNHEIDQVGLIDHWVHTEELREKRMKTKLFSTKEKAYVRPAFNPDGMPRESHFHCIVCDADFVKRQCTHHMATVHGVDKDDAKDWLAALDGNVIRNTKSGETPPPQRLLLTAAWLRECQTGDLLHHGVAKASGDAHDKHDENYPRLASCAKLSAKPKVRAKPIGNPQLPTATSSSSGCGPVQPAASVANSDTDFVAVPCKVEPDTSALRRNPDGTIFEEADGSVWKALWVRLTPSMQPVQPVQTMEIQEVAAHPQHIVVDEHCGVATAAHRSRQQDFLSKHRSGNVRKDKDGACWIPAFLGCDDTGNLIDPVNVILSPDATQAELQLQAKGQASDAAAGDHPKTTSSRQHTGFSPVLEQMAAFTAAATAVVGARVPRAGHACQAQVTGCFDDAVPPAEIATARPPAAVAPAAAAADVKTVVTDAVAAALKTMAPKRAAEPEVAIKSEWLTWVPDGSSDAERRQCPLQREPKLDLAGYEDFLKTHRRLSEKDTIPARKANMQNIFGMLDIKYDEAKVATSTSSQLAVGLAAAMHRRGITCQLFGLPILNEDYGWSREMFVSFKHFLRFTSVAALSDGFDEDRRAIELSLVSLEGITKLHTVSRNQAGDRKSQKDAARIESMPTKSEVKDVCTKAMCDIWHLKNVTSGNSDLTVKERSAANAIVIGLLHLNGKAGRCGEWMRMRMADVSARLLVEKENYLVASKHKTSYKRGAATKVLAEGTIKAIEVFLTLPGQSECEFFLQPPKKGSAGGGQTMAAYIKKFDLVYFGRIVHWGSNLFRKRDATRAHIDASANYKKLHAWSGMHSVAVTEKNYVALTLKKKAEIDKALMDVEIEPIGWPSEDVLASTPTTWFTTDKAAKAKLAVLIASLKMKGMKAKQPVHVPDANGAGAKSKVGKKDKSTKRDKKGMKKKAIKTGTANIDGNGARASSPSGLSLQPGASSSIQDHSLFQCKRDIAQSTVCQRLALHRAFRPQSRRLAVAISFRG